MTSLGKEQIVHQNFVKFINGVLGNAARVRYIFMVGYITRCILDKIDSLLNI